MLDRISSISFLIVRTIAILVIVMSLVVMYGWLTKSYEIITLFSDMATMKFNTALAFHLTGWSLFFFSKKRMFFQRAAILIVFAACGLTVLEYLFSWPVSIDNLIVNDIFSKTFPGRMSLGTALCFMLISVAMSLSNYKAVKKKRKGLYFLGAIVIICILAVITFVLNIPIQVRVRLIDTMSISTAVLFLLISYALYKKNNAYGLERDYLKDLAGNRLMRFLLPFVLILPLTLSFILLKLITAEKLDIEFGIILYTIAFTIGGLLYIAFLGIRLNKVDFKRKKLQEFFRTSNLELSQFKYALDKSSLITITGADGKIMYANDKFCEISKYTRDEIIGQENDIVDAGYHSKSFFEDLYKTIRAGNVWTGGIKNRAKDGTFYWVHTSIVPFKDRNGEVYKFLDIRQDITKEKVLSEQYENLKLRNQEIEQFSFIASHDLQEPLNTLKSVVSLMTEEYEDKLDDEAKHYLGFMEKTTTRMENSIRGLLAYSRIGNSKELISLDSGEVVKQILADLDVSIKATQAEISYEGLPKLNAYAKEFPILFKNLIDNAIKFARKEHVPEIKILAKEDEEFWQFSISDNGIGIQKEYSQKVFAIFTRLNNREDYDGAGIGLAHCEKIVRLHSGTIWFDSEVNNGTTFHFTISKNLT